MSLIGTRAYRAILDLSGRNIQAVNESAERQPLFSWGTLSDLSFMLSRRRMRTMTCLRRNFTLNMASGAYATNSWFLFLQMGWIKSPHSFCVSSQTSPDVALLDAETLLDQC